MIAATGGTASCSPDIELQMGHGWPATGRLLKAGIRPTIRISSRSIDSSVSPSNQSPGNRPVSQPRTFSCSVCVLM